jgi:two-component system sensor histidine kinase KdpD
MADKLTLTKERLLVCVGPGLDSADLIRAAQNLAVNLQAEWFAVYVEDPRMLRLPEAERNRAVYNLRLAEQLGAETITLRGRSIAAEIVNFARQRHIRKIVAGKPRGSGWRAIFSRSPVDDLVRLAGGIDVYVISGTPGAQKEPARPIQPKSLRRPEYEIGLLYFILATVVSFVMYPYFALSNLIMVYLVGVMVTAIYCGRGPAILNSILSVLGFDFWFVPPRFTFLVEERHYILTFAVMFLVALVISHLTSLIRRQAEAARLQERQTAAMQTLSQQLAGTRGMEPILQVGVQRLGEILGCEVVGLLPDAQARLHVASGDLAAVFHRDIIKELTIAQWTYENAQMAGWGTQQAPTSEILYVPLRGASSTLGVLALRPRDPESAQWLLPEQLRLRFLESLAKQVALALEVERLEKAALEAKIAMDTEHLRSSLLSSVTHDFQTPLAAIMGSASSLIELQGQVDPQTAREMLTDIYDEAENLSRLTYNLLSIARLESGSLTLHQEVQPLEEVLGASLNRLDKRLADRQVQISLAPDLPMLPLDAALAEQLFINLLENALKYTPAGSPLSITASRQGEAIEVVVADNGPGFPPEDLDKIFDMFYQGAQGSRPRGHGLGLFICRAIVEAHGGRLEAFNRDAGGAAVRFTLPLAPEDKQITRSS